MASLLTVDTAVLAFFSGLAQLALVRAVVVKKLSVMTDPSEEITESFQSRR